MTKRDPTTIRHGDDVHQKVGDLYRVGRTYPGGKAPHDYESPERTTKPGAPQPSWDEQYARYGAARVSKVSPAPDESACQFPSEKIGDHVDVPVSDWTRSGTHPHFDAGASSFRRSTKVRR